MSKLVFTPEMFDHPRHMSKRMTFAEAAYYAQIEFDNWLSEQVVVYGNDNGTSEHWAKKEWPGNTHTAKLIDIQPIEKPKCDHFPPVSNDSGRFGVVINIERPMKCSKCGVDLKMTFTEAE